MTRGLVSILVLVGCARSPGPTPTSTAAATTPAASEAAGASDGVVELEALAADPSAALPGTRVRHGRYDVRQLLRGGGFVVAMTEELEVHQLGGRLVGRIASEGDHTPMPSSSLVFVTDEQGRLEHVIWRSRPGTGAVVHELGEVTARHDGSRLELVRTKGLSSSIQRMTFPGAWTLDETLALEHLPLWSPASTARPEQASWVCISLLPGPKPQRIRLAQRGKETIVVGGHEVAAWRYQAVGEAPLSAVIWVDEQGFVVRRLEQEAGDESTQWDAIYVPLPGDRLAR